MASLIKLTGWDDVKELILHHLSGTKSSRDAASVCKDFYKTIVHLERNQSLTLNKKVSSQLKPRRCTIAATCISNR